MQYASRQMRSLLGCWCASKLIGDNRMSIMMMNIVNGLIKIIADICSGRTKNSGATVLKIQELYFVLNLRVANLFQNFSKT